MARHKADPKSFLTHLEAALQRAKPKDEVNQTELANILGMTARNLVETYIKPDSAFPMIERGSEGRGYRFNLVKVLKHLIKQTRSIIGRNEQRNAEQARRLNFSVAESDAGASLADLRVQMDLTLKAQAQRREQQDKIDAGAASLFLAGLNQTIRDTIMGTGSVIDPIGDLDPERRAAFDDHMRDLCLLVQARIGTFIRESGADPITGGNI